jgi:hypothetical protein
MPTMNEILDLPDGKRDSEGESLVGSSEVKPEPIRKDGLHSSSEEPFGISEVTTPSGDRIYYQAGPKRLYRVNDCEVPSVTQVLDVLHKPALVWWGMKIGVEGVGAAYKTEYVDDFTGEVTPALKDVEMWWEEPEAVVNQLTTRKLTVNHVRDKAGTRGTSVHTALERWSVFDIYPIVEEFPEEEQGYVRGVIAFLEDLGDVSTRIKNAEVMVGSHRHGYAGRFDLDIDLAEGCEFSVSTGKREKKAFFPAGRYLLDLKTSKGVYDSMYLQLAAYAHAMKECGYGSPDAAAIVRVNDEGKYAVSVSPANFLHFKPVLDTYYALQELKDA